MASLLLNQGTQMQVLAESPNSAGTTIREFSIQSDSVLLGVVVRSIAGSLNISLYGLVDGQQTLILAYPAINAATTSALLRRSTIIPSGLRLVVTYTGAVDYEIHARAVAAGTSDTKILGASGWNVSQVTVGMSAMQLIAVSLTDRAGTVVKNWSGTQTVYLAESAAKATSGIGYPLAPKDALAMDISAGAEIWIVSDAIGADIRIIEAGG